MQTLNSLKTKVFQTNDQNFEQHALELFRFQYNNNKIYQAYVNHIGVNPANVLHLKHVPFLPIQFFKSHEVRAGNWHSKHIFQSSGTTGATSKHYIEDLDFYKKISYKIFSQFFSDVEKSIVIGLLPSYLERDNSSLVYMVNSFIDTSKNVHSGFYLSNLSDLVKKLEDISRQDIPIYLFGVTFALLNLAEKHELNLKNVYVLETGGMKGRGAELTREELHKKLRDAFHTERVFSEYGMTELLSQAYMKNEGLFHTPPWMKVLIREIYDPFSFAENSKTGIINVIDLANVHSCAFIETEDLGVRIGEGFKVLGRLDNSDLRGCNLLLS